MATQVTPYEFVPDIRRRAEELRMANVRQAVRGSIQAHSITADMMAVGVLNVGSGAVTIDNGAITANEIAANVLRVGTSGAVTIDNDAITAPMLNVDTLSAITATMGSLTAGDITSTTFTGGLIQSGTSSPNTVLSAGGLVLTNAQTAETVNAAPSHIDFYSDSGADSQQKGTVACFIGDSSVSYAPHLTLRALTPDGSHGRSSVAIWDGTDYITSFDLFASRSLSHWTTEAGFTTFAFKDGSDTKISGSWNHGDLSALAFHSLPSDRAAKRKIKKLGGGLAAVKALNPVSYELRQNGRPMVGFVADEVKTAIPDAVSTIAPPQGMEEGEPASALDHMQLITHAIGAIQELATRVEALERK